MTERLSMPLPGGGVMPRLGQGTWHMGDDARKRGLEIAALGRGVALGMTHIDSAEMYGDGRAEKLVGEAIKGLDRKELYLVSKVYPHNAGRANIFKSCEKSIARMGCGYLDLYLLHWRGGVPLSETVACMEELVKRGQIRRWGVSNFDLGDMNELYSIKDGKNCAVNQVLFHLGSRGVEYALLPWLRERGIPLVAYCPLAQAGSLRRGLLENRAVTELANARGLTPAQVLLCFVLGTPGVAAIPKASQSEHTALNAACAHIKLTEEERAALDRALPPPARPVPLDIV